MCCLGGLSKCMVNLSFSFRGKFDAHLASMGGLSKCMVNRSFSFRGKFDAYLVDVGATGLGMGQARCEAL